MWADYSRKGAKAQSRKGTQSFMGWLAKIGQFRLFCEPHSIHHFVEAQ
jgi:hypothetical protein